MKQWTWIKVLFLSSLRLPFFIKIVIIFLVCLIIVNQDHVVVHRKPDRQVYTYQKQIIRKFSNMLKNKILELFLNET